MVVEVGDGAPAVIPPEGTQDEPSPTEPGSSEVVGADEVDTGGTDGLNTDDSEVPELVS